MKLFQATREYLIENGLSPHNKHFNQGYFTALVILTSAITLNCVFLCQEAKTAREFTECLYVIAVNITMALWYTIIAFKSSQLFDYFDEFEENVTTRIENSPASKTVHNASNKLVEKLSKIFRFLLVYVSAPGIIVPRAMLSYFVYFTTDLGANAFELPFQMWFPFDWRNPIGYLIAIRIQYTYAYRTFRFVPCLMCATLGSFLSATTLANDINGDLSVINESVKTRKPLSRIFKQVCEFVRAHSNGKRLLESYSDVYENILTVLFTFCLLTICMAMLMIQLQIVKCIESNNNIGSVVLLESVFYACYSFGTVAFACELGQRVTDALGQIDDTIAMQDWYLYPIEIQKMLPIMIANAHQPVVCKCFGNISCSRETFRKVTNKAYSYFMVLRKFY